MQEIKGFSILTKSMSVIAGTQFYQLFFYSFHLIPFSFLTAMCHISILSCTVSCFSWVWKSEYRLCLKVLIYFPKERGWSLLWDFWNTTDCFSYSSCPDISRFSTNVTNTKMIGIQIIMGLVDHDYVGKSIMIFMKLY